VATVPPLQALRAALLADPLVSAAVGDRVYVGRVPGAAAGIVPETAGVMLRAAGGPGAPRHAALVAIRVNVHAYGPTPYSADLAHYVVHDALRRIERQVIAGTLIHSVLAEGGPTLVADPTTDAPEVVSTWALLTAEEVPA
jgi:hypothetical protein